MALPEYSYSDRARWDPVQFERERSAAAARDIADAAAEVEQRQLAEIAWIVRQADHLDPLQVAQMVADVDAQRLYRLGGPAPAAVRPEEGEVAFAYRAWLEGLPTEMLLALRSTVIKREGDRYRARAAAERQRAAAERRRAAQVQENAQRVIDAIWAGS